MKGFGGFAGEASILAFVMFIGCAQAPRQKTADANEAIDYAKAIGADSLARTEFERANNAFGGALNSIVAENMKLPFLRNYEKANKLLDDAMNLADKASRSAKAEREWMRAAAEKAHTGNAKVKAISPKAKRMMKKRVD